MVVVSKLKDKPFLPCSIEVHPDFIQRVALNFFHHHVVDKHTTAAGTSTTAFNSDPFVVNGGNGNVGDGLGEGVNVGLVHAPLVWAEFVQLSVAQVEDLAGAVVTAVDSAGTRIACERVDWWGDLLGGDLIDGYSGHCGSVLAFVSTDIDWRYWGF